MLVSRRAFLAVSSLAVAARPLAGQELGPGQHRLELDAGRDGLVYLPRGYRPGVPMPLVMMLHGAGGSGRSVADTFPLADELGIIILGPDSRDERTWDVILSGFGPDVEFLGAAFQQSVRRCAVDRRRLAIAGHSDGATMALSLGIGTGDRFGRIMAVSPGVMSPVDVRGKPRIFISHGIGDTVMPIDDTSRKFVPRLKALGYDVTYREYDGGHRVPPPVVREGFDWFMR
jgi:phospholipase/carboxylesterase